MNFKNFFNYTFLLCALVFGAILTSCTFSEKIIIEENGSGSYNMDIDLSGLLSYKNENKKKYNHEGKAMEKIDSTIVFSDFIDQNKDSIANLSIKQRNVLESLKGGSMKMIVDEKNEEMSMNFNYDFTESNELNQMYKKVSRAFSFYEKKEENDKIKLGDLSYSYTTKSFKRISSSLKKTKTEEEEHQKSMDEMAMFFVGSSFNLEYQFPKKIKKTTAQNATFSDDKKTMYISLSLEEFMRNESLLDFEVKF